MKMSGFHPFFLQIKRSVISRNLKLSGDLLADNEQDQMRTSNSTVEQQNINNTQAAADKVKPKNNKEAGLLSAYTYL